MSRAFSTKGRCSPAWRPFIIVTLLTMVLVGLPVVASAGPPTSYISNGLDISCESESGFFGLHVGQDQDFTYLDVYFESFEEPFILFGNTEDFVFDGTSLSAELEMFAQLFDDGEEPVPVGVGFIEAAVEPIGEPEIFSDRFREGNRWVEIRDVIQPVAVTGSAVLEGYLDFDFGECTGNLFESEYWTTNPNAYSARNEGQYLECGLEGPGGGFGYLYAESGSYGMYLDLYAVPAEGSGLFGFSQDFTFTDSALSALVDMFDDTTGEGPLAQAAVEASLESAGISTSDIISQDSRSKIVTERFNVSGMVMIDDLEFAMVDCYAESYVERVHSSNPSGPKPTGKTPVNDVPEGALSLDARGTVNAQTKATANAPEVACTYEFEEPENGPGEFPIPIGKTLWYSFEGTGEPVTIDSAGSSFDTVMGIYDTEFNQIVCVDDVGDEFGWSLQAAATIDTEEGHEYLVQIGGFGFFEEPEFENLAQYGRVRLNMR